MMSSRVEIILDNTPFPGAGQQIGGYEVIESMLDIDGKNWAVYLKGKLNQAQAKLALKDLTNKHHVLPVQDEFSLVSFKSKGMLHARTNPPGDVTVVRGHMYYARPNPITTSDFHNEMNEMLIDNPEKHFTRYTVKTTEQLHDRLWKGVSYAGESYGWKRGDDLWHRRASFIMPKIKINKALEGATMFYHTHPAKDEPSLTSADDIQFYLDLHFAWGIKSFYTIMKHKLDHFTITSKAGGKEKYLRMEEEAFIDTVDGMIEEGEKVAKKEVGNDRPEIEFQNRITKEMVDLFNKKFKSIAKISFRPKAKNPASKLARKPSNNPIAALVNPAPNPPIKVDDRFVAKALDELKGLDYAHEHYGADEYGHTMYVYWWLKHHLAPTTQFPKGRLWKLNEYGMDSDTRKKLRAYLSQPVLGNYNYMDIVYLLALYHDIAKLREKGVKETGWEIGAEMFRNEIGPEIGLPSKLTEDIAFLLDTDVGRKGITDKDFLTQAGDYYGASKLLHMADMITHHPTMYKGGDSMKQELMVNFIDQLRDFLDHHYVIPNPPPQVATLKWVADYGISDLYYEEVDELLGVFHQSVVPDNDGKTKSAEDRSSGGHLYRLRFNSSLVPGLTRYYAGNLALSSSKLVIDVGAPVPDDLGKADANLIYRAVGERLKESYPELVIEEVEPESLVNPRHANKIQVISISGPSGGGKSTVLRYLNKHIPDSSTPPTFTTRPKRPTDGADRRFVSKTTFKKMIEQGQFVEYTVSGAGHYYGRRFKDFYGKVAIIEVSLDGKKHYESRFANVFSVYLDPDPSITEEERAKAIYKRGGLTKEEAKRRAKIATETVERSKKMQFDLRVTMMKGKYEDGAKKVLSEIPLVNPASTFMLLEEPFRPAQLDLDGNLLPLTPLQLNRNAQIRTYNTRQQDAYNAGTHIPWTMAHRSDFPVNAILPPAWFHDLVKGVKYGLVPANIVNTVAPIESWGNPSKKELFDWFEDWVKLVNMKNKELKTFLDSDWGKVAGLSPQEAKDWNNIKSGRVSGRRILKMRKKLGLTGPKDYIDPNKPRILEDYYEKALNNWTGPSDDMQKGETDWDWCKRQVRFNKRFMGDVFGERKGPLVRKQKTQNQPSRRLLSLWVWGHDPWRYARKVEKRERMPKCPSVPWVGMTEKRKWGVIEVIPGPKNKPKKNPAWPEEWQSNPYVTLIEPWTGMEVMIDEEIAPLIQAMWGKDIQTINSNQATSSWGYIAVKGSFDKIKAVVPEMELHQPAMQVEVDHGVQTALTEKAKNDFRSKGYIALVNVKKGAFSEHPIMGPMWDTDYLILFTKEGQNALHTAFGIPLPNPMVRVKKDEYRSYFMDEEGNDLTSIPFESVSFTAGQNVANFGEPMTRKEALTEREGTWWRVNVSAYKGRKPIIEVAPIKHFTSPGEYNRFVTRGRTFYKNFSMEGPVFPTMLTHMAQEPSAILIVQGDLKSFGEEELRSDITDWKGVSKGEGKLPVYESGEIVAVDSEQLMVTFTPVKNELRVEAHIVNHTKNVSEQVSVLRLEDRGDHYWLHEIQVSPEHRGQNWFRWGVETMLFNLVDRIPDYPNKKPVRTLARVVEGIPQKELVRVLEETGFKKIEEVDGGVLMEFDYHLFEEVFANPSHTPSRSNPPTPHDGDAIITVNEVPWGTQIIAECPFDGTKWAVDSSMEDACNHIYPECGHVLRINPDKPCCCENSEHPPTHPDHWPNTRDNPPIIPIHHAYHATPTRNVPSIMKEGLRLSHYERTKIEPAVYLTYTETQGRKMAKWREEKSGEEHTVLKIDLATFTNEDVGAEPWEYDSFPVLDQRMKENITNTNQLMITRPIPPEFIEVLERVNPRTKKGRKFPSKYLKGLTATERAIAKYEIDKGYEYSMDDPEAYKFWKSDIKAKARGMEILPSKWRNKFARKYGPLKDGYDFLDRMSKTTGIKRKYLKKIQDKGLAAWRIGHRPGVTQMQWARGRVYAFVMAAPSSTAPGKPDHKLAVEAGVR